MVTTDLQLEVDEPVDFGLEDVCKYCMKYAKRGQWCNCVICVLSCCYIKRKVWWHTLELASQPGRTKLSC